MNTVEIKRESQALRLSRFAIVLSDPLRLKIVAELYMREMSPSQFFAEFGGGSVARVYRHFQILAGHGWLKFIREESGGRRRGGVEHFYRATEMAVLDYELFTELPYSVRATFSSTTFEQYAERVIEAVKAGTFDARPDNHATCLTLVVDRPGWEHVIDAAEELFYALHEKQADAKVRAFESNEKLTRATVALGLFESPSHTKRGLNETKINLVQSTDCQFPFTWRVSKVFADLLCLKILVELNQRDMSATQFHRKFGGAAKSGIHRRFKLLADLGWLVMVDEITGGARRGAKERFYRATKPAVLDAGCWPDVPESIKTTSEWRSFEQFSDRVRDALEAGTLDARYDRHLTWSSLLLDQIGWERVMTALDGLVALALSEQENAKQRIATSKGKLLTMTFAQAAFESPKGSAKAP